MGGTQLDVYKKAHPRRTRPQDQGRKYGLNKLWDWVERSAGPGEATNIRFNTDTEIEISVCPRVCKRGSSKEFSNLKISETIGNFPNPFSQFDAVFFNLDLTEALFSNFEFFFEIFRKVKKIFERE